ncbi:MAG TPA: sulfocyanin-like copper-binding protein [Gemmatimonadales bacterium]|nr:sulfocyanin-like copper-binding protein [Gemmatimonadales bacterium]
MHSQFRPVFAACALLALVARGLAAQGGDTSHAHHARQAPAPASTAANGAEWIKWDAATNTVTFRLVAGPFDFNGYTSGRATLVVPSRSNVVINFEQNDGTPHSAVIIEDKDPMPTMADQPAIPRAYTNKASEGLPQGSKDVIRFTAPESGSYRIFCGVPGHGLSGMWIRFKVDPAAKEPRWETTTQ